MIQAEMTTTSPEHSQWLHAGRRVGQRLLSLGSNGCPAPKALSGWESNDS